MTPSVSARLSPPLGVCTQQMIVIAHQDIAVKAKMKVFYRPIEQFQKPLSVPVVPKDRLSLIASGGDVIVRSRIFYPQGPGHERDFYQKR